LNKHLLLQYLIPLEKANGHQACQNLLQAPGLLERHAKVPEETAKQWFIKQALWQIYLSAPRYIPWPKFDVSAPNAVHQKDLFLPYNKLPRGHKIYKYVLTVLNVASHYKEAEPQTSKDSAEVAKAFQSICKRSPLTWPQLLQVDPRCKFMGSVKTEMENHKTTIRCGCPDTHRDQAVVEHFNRTLAERLFGH